jgi:hypothetical protein
MLDDDGVTVDADDLVDPVRLAECHGFLLVQVLIGSDSSVSFRPFEPY